MFYRRGIICSCFKASCCIFSLPKIQNIFWKCMKLSFVLELHFFGTEMCMFGYDVHRIGFLCRSKSTCMKAASTCSVCCSIHFLLLILTLMIWCQIYDYILFFFDIRDTHILQTCTIKTCKSTHALQNKCSVLDHYFNCWRVIEVWKSLSESNSGDSKAILFVPEGGRLASCVWVRWVFVASPKVKTRTIFRPV